MLILLEKCDLNLYDVFFYCYVLISDLMVYFVFDSLE